MDTEERVRLILVGMAVTSTDGPALCISNAKKVYLELKDGTQNVLTDGTGYTDSLEAKGALFSNDTLVLEGGGSLTVTGNCQHAIASDDDIIVNSSVITVSASVDGFHANDNITNGGSITVLKPMTRSKAKEILSSTAGR